MTQINQLVAVEQGVKARANDALTEAYKAIQRKQELEGVARTYQPVDEENGEKLPPERKLVQVKAEDALRGASDALIRLLDVQLTKDEANTAARGDIKVGTTVIASDVPVTNLMTLEKHLVNLRTFISKLPTLDPGEQWMLDPNLGVWATAPTQTTRTKKVLRNHVKAEATDKHPAQVETYAEDVIVGYWTKIAFSGAVPATRVAQLTLRVDALIEAVKFAREQANTNEVTDRNIGASIFGYLLAE